MAFRWTHLAFFAFLVLFLVFPFWAFHGFTKEFGLDGTGDPFRLCLRDLEEGRLYTDQPRCGQGPVFFWTLWAVHQLSGNRFDFAVRLLIVGLNALLLGLIGSVTRQYSRAWWTMPLVGLVYLPLMYAPSLNRLETLLATVFFFGGVFKVIFNRC